MSHAFRSAALLLLLSALLSARPAQAETYHTCAGFIDSVPAVVSTQGVWCLRSDLATAAATGSAIVIAANNVTIDCNGFKLGGLAAGDASQASGIRATAVQNASVRNCNIRGFARGVSFDQGAGHLVEDNRFDNNLTAGIDVCCDLGNLVRRNRVYDTGGSSFFTSATAIRAYGDIIDNTIRGVNARASGIARGINAGAWGAVVRGNSATSIVSDASGSAVAVGIADATAQTIADNVVSHLATGNGAGIGIHATGGQAQIAGNRLHALYGGTYGIRATGADAVCTGNSAIGFATAAFSSCEASEGNVAPP